MARKPGATQRAALNALSTHLFGGDGASWSIGPASTTLRILESLERAGLAKRRTMVRKGHNLRQFVLTDAGRAEARRGALL